MGDPFGDYLAKQRGAPPYADGRRFAGRVGTPAPAFLGGFPKGNVSSLETEETVLQTVLTRMSAPSEMVDLELRSPSAGLPPKRR